MPLKAQSITIEQEYYPHEGVAFVSDRSIITESSVNVTGDYSFTRTATSTEVASVHSTSTAEGVKLAVERVFGENHYMVGVAKCESELRQFKADGTVLMGGYKGRFVGVFQIGVFWEAKAKSLGYDIYTTEGNIGFAHWLWTVEGPTQWECYSK